MSYTPGLFEDSVDPTPGLFGTDEPRRKVAPKNPLPPMQQIRSGFEEYKESTPEEDAAKELAESKIEYPVNDVASGTVGAIQGLSAAVPGTKNFAPISNPNSNVSGRGLGLFATGLGRSGAALAAGGPLALGADRAAQIAYETPEAFKERPGTVALDVAANTAAGHLAKVVPLGLFKSAKSAVAKGANPLRAYGTAAGGTVATDMLAAEAVGQSGMATAGISKNDPRYAEAMSDNRKLGLGLSLAANVLPFAKGMRSVHNLRDVPGQSPAMESAMGAPTMPIGTTPQKAFMRLPDGSYDPLAFLDDQTGVAPRPTDHGIRPPDLMKELQHEPTSVLEAAMGAPTGMSMGGVMSKGKGFAMMPGGGGKKPPQEPPTPIGADEPPPSGPSSHFGGKFNLDTKGYSAEQQAAVNEGIASDPISVLNARNPRTMDKVREGAAAVKILSPADAAKVARDPDIAPAEKVTALFQAEKGYSTKHAELSAAYEANPTPETEAAKFESLKSMVEFTQAARGTGSEYGRALRAMQEVMKERRDLGGKPIHQALAEKLASINGGKVEMTTELLKKIDSISATDPEKATKAMRLLSDEAMKYATTPEKLERYFLTNIFSGPRTQVQNVFGSGTNLASETAVSALDTLLDPVVSKMFGNKRQHYVGELVPSAVGLATGWKEGAARGWYTLKNGFSKTDAATLTQSDSASVPVRSPEFRGGLANPYNAVLRGMKAGDEFFKGWSEQVEVRKQAVKVANAEGMKGKAYKARVAELTNNPTPEMMDKAAEFGQTVTFTEKPDVVLGNLNKLFNSQVPEDFSILPGLRPLKFLQPVISTAYNIAKTGVRRSPLGLVRLTGKSGRENATHVMSEAVFGSAIVIGTGMALADTEITGPAPKDQAERDAWYRAGNQPYSIKKFGRWWDYRAAGPLAFPIVAVAAYKDASKRGATDPNVSIAGETFATIGKTFTDMTFMSGLSGLMNAFVDPTKDGEKVIARLLGGFVPLSGLNRNITQATDPYIKDAEGLYEKITSSLPGLSYSVPNRKDNLGRDIVRRGGTGAMALVSPYPAAKAEPVDSVSEPMHRLGVFPPAAQKTITDNDKEYTLTREQRAEYADRAGMQTERRILGLLKQDGYDQRTAEKKKDQMQRRIGLSRNNAKLSTLRGIRSEGAPTPRLFEDYTPNLF